MRINLRPRSVPIPKREKGAATYQSPTWGDGREACTRIIDQEFTERPTVDAYEAACKALAHWRKEAKRLGKIAGVTPREMKRK